MLHGLLMDPFQRVKFLRKSGTFFCPFPFLSIHKTHKQPKIRATKVNITKTKKNPECFVHTFTKVRLTYVTDIDDRAQEQLFDKRKNGGFFLIRGLGNKGTLPLLV